MLLGACLYMFIHVYSTCINSKNRHDYSAIKEVRKEGVLGGEGTVGRGLLAIFYFLIWVLVI